jgi:hypothetical protein
VKTTARRDRRIGAEESTTPRLLDSSSLVTHQPTSLRRETSFLLTLSVQVREQRPPALPTPNRISVLIQRV